MHAQTRPLSLLTEEGWGEKTIVLKEIHCWCCDLSWTQNIRSHNTFFICIMVTHSCGPASEAPVARVAQFGDELWWILAVNPCRMRWPYTTGLPSVTPYTWDLCNHHWWWGAFAHVLATASPALATSCDAAVWGPQHWNGACAQRCPGEEPPLPQPLLGWVTARSEGWCRGEKQRQKQSQCRAKSLSILVLSSRGGDQRTCGLLPACALHPAPLLKAAMCQVSWHRPARARCPHVHTGVPSAAAFTCRSLPSAGTFHLLAALGLSLSCSFAFQSHVSPGEAFFPRISTPTSTWLREGDVQKVAGLKSADVGYQAVTHFRIGRAFTSSSCRTFQNPRFQRCTVTYTNTLEMETCQPLQPFNSLAIFLSSLSIYNLTNHVPSVFSPLRTTTLSWVIPASFTPHHQDWRQQGQPVRVKPTGLFLFRSKHFIQNISAKSKESWSRLWSVSKLAATFY